MNRYNFKATIDHKINNYIKAGASMLYTYKNKDARNSSVFSQSMKMTTITHAYLKDGSINKTPNPRYAAHCNPLLDEVDGAYQNNTLSSRFFGNAYIEINPIKNLNFKSTFALDRNNSRHGIYEDYQSVGNFQSPAKTEISLEYSMNTGFTWENTLNYTTNFGTSLHSLTALLGHSMSQSTYEQTKTSGPAGQEHYYTSAFYDLTKITDKTTTSAFVKQAMLSFFGRINYKYADKYLLTASIRADGSTPLAEGHKWGYFPSLAAAWRINEESFMGNTKNWLSNLKLRASWGISGNAAINPYQTIATLSKIPIYYYVNGNDIAGYIPSSMGNPNLAWEKTASLNFGVDFSILNNRISGSIDYFTNNTTDLLFQKSIPPSSVYPSVIGNFGKTEGKGVEVSLNTIIVQNKDFRWDINWSYSSFQDKVVSLTDSVTRNISGTSGQIVGEPVLIYYDYEANGCWGVGEFDSYKEAWQTRHPEETMEYISSYGTPGTIKVKDKDDNGKLDDNDKIIYNRSPKHIFGMNNSFKYKNFSLDVLVYARIGGYISYGMNSLLNFESANWGDLDYWTSTNTSAKFPNPGLTSATQSTHTNYGSSLLYEKADYIKIKDITLAYLLPDNLLKNIGIDNLKVYCSLKNFFTFASIDNYDPERGGSISFPLAKQFVVGVNIQF